MMPTAQAAEIIERYRLRGWVGQALAQRVRKHARLLASLDPDVSGALERSLTRGLGVTL